MATNGVQVLERAFDILDILSLEPEGLGITQIAERVALHKSTVHRIITALAERGYVEKSQRGTQYRIGLKIVDICSVYLNTVELKTEARPVLRDLTQRTGFTSHLAILDGSAAVYIDKVEVEQSLRLYSQIGRRIPAHCSALGKCLLSGLSEKNLDTLLSTYDFKKFTEHTLTSEIQLRQQIVEIHKRGYATDDQEHEDSIRCVAAPIYDYRGKIVAAISMSGPAQCLIVERTDEFAALILQAAKEISIRLGHG
jgi:IclR family KDG regulon transcriptional repressor